MQATERSHPLAASFQTWMESPVAKHRLMAGASSEKVASAAAIAGPRAAADHAASKALATKAETDPDGAKADFKKRPMDGCTSLLNMARVKAGFNPTAGMTGTNATAYADFIKRVMACPLFNLDMNDQQSVHRDSSDYDQLIDAVVNTFDGVESEDKDKIKTSVQNLVKAAASNSNTTETTDLFVQNVLYAGDSSSNQPAYAIYIYSSHVQMTDNKSKGHHSMQEDFSVQRTKLTFRINDWQYFSDAVWGKQHTSVDDWLDDNTTPAGNSTTLVTCAQVKWQAAE
jgi:hypothetical protein